MIDEYVAFPPDSKQNSIGLRIVKNLSQIECYFSVWFLCAGCWTEWIPVFSVNLCSLRF